MNPALRKPSINEFYSKGGMNQTLKLLGLWLAIIGSAFSITFCAIGLGLYMIGLLLELTFDKGTPHPRYPAGKFLFPLLISLLISLFVSHYFKVSLRGFWKFLEGFILLYASIDVIRTPKELRWVVFTLAGVFFLAALSGIFQDIFGFDFVYFRQAINASSELPKRLTGSFKHYNDYGSFLVPGFSIALALFLTKLSDRKILGAIFSAVLFFMLSYAITRTLSRSALLAVFASLFFFSIFFRYRWFAIGGLVALIFALWTVPSPLSARLKDIFSESAPERLLLLKTTLSMIKAKPFFGLGLNTYSDYFPQFRPKTYPAIMYAHNSYLQMAAEIGIVGFCLYLLLILALIGSAVKAFFSNGSSHYKILTIGIVSAVFGMMVNALFESLLQSTQLRTIFWCLLGIATAVATNFLSADGNPSMKTDVSKPDIWSI